MASYSFLDFELDPNRYELRRKGRNVPLEKIPMDLLILLLEKKGDLVSREEIIERIWGKGVFVDSEGGTNTAIRKIRQALHDDLENPRFIQTLIGRGYRFLTPITVVEKSPQGLNTGSTNAAAGGQAGQRELRSPQSWMLWAAASALVVFVLVLLGLNVRGSRGWLLGRPAAIHSLAVLPLENLSGNPDEEYFADGMTDELITDLAQVSALRVVSRTSVMRYKGVRKSLPEIARDLNVDAVLEGSVIRSGKRVRITAQLIQAVPEQHLWASAYERDLADVVALQGDVARAIATEIQIKLTPEEQTRLARVQPIDPEALEAYLKGVYEWDKWAEEGLKKSIAYFEQAIQKDPHYAQAWTGLSDSYGLLGDLQFWPPPVALPKAKAAALTAIDLDETLSEAHVSLGAVLLHQDWSWSAAQKELQRAIALNPNDATAHQWNGYYMLIMGRFDRAIAEMERAVELDPLSPNKQNSLGAAFYRAGRYDEALRQIREVPDGDVNSELRHRRMAAIYERKGMQKEAVNEMLNGLKFTGHKDLAATVGQEYRASGYRAAKEALLRGEIMELRNRMERGRAFGGSTRIAADYALLGEKNKAFEWLEKAFQARDAEMVYLKVDDNLEALRSDPRFQDLVRRMGLPP